MDNWIEPPPPRQKGVGCCGKGCLTLFGLLLLLVIALIGGGYYGVRNYYLAPDPVPLPTPQENTATATENQPEMKQEEVKQRLDTFNAAARRSQPARAGLSAGDINALIDRNSKSRGTTVVAIEGDTARVQMSIPLSRFDVPWQRSLGLADRYLNAQFSVHSPADGNLGNLSITDLTVNNHSVPGDALDFRVTGRSARDYLLKYSNKYNVSGLQIVDGKVVLESNQSR